MAFQTNAFQNDAFQQAGVTVTFTADAVLLKTASATFTADAELAGAVTSATFTADAYLLSIVSASFTADSILFKTVTATFTGDAYLVTVTAATFTADAVLNKTASATFTGNAVILKTQTSTKTANAVIKKTDNAFTFAADAEITLTVRVSATFTANAVIKKTLSFTRTANAVIKKTGISRTFTADALIVEVGQKVFGAQAILVRKIFEDNYNRTGPDIGTPSGLGYYATNGENFGNNFVSQAILDNNALTIIPDEWYSITRTSPATDRGYVQFDFYIPDIADFDDVYYAVQQAITPTGTGLYFYKYLWVAKDFAQDWFISAGDLFEEFTVVNGEWYTVKYWFDNDLSGQEAVKVWLRSDPEPVGWLAEGPPATQSGLTPYYDTTAFIELEEEFADENSDHIAFDNYVVWTASPNVFASFSADAVIGEPTGETAYPFTADARLVLRTTEDFTADAWIQGSFGHTFTANAVLFRPASAGESESTGLRKNITLHVAQRRPVALSAYVPPRNPDDSEQTDDGNLDLPCLPPCPEYPAGWGSNYGANGAVLRRTVYYCDSCGVYVYTFNNKMGIGTGTTSGHPGCEASHSRSLHESRIFADYSSIPVTDVGMVAKLFWDGDAPSSVGIKVFANIPEMPPLSDDGDFVPWSSEFQNDYWTSGDYIGNLNFEATDTATTAVGGDVQWCDIASSLTVRPESLMSDIFRFEIEDLTQYYGAEFRAPNVTVTVGS